MNYRHAFHAGNFADLVKHAAVTLVIARLTEASGPLLVLDSHAGAGAYDLDGDMARKSREAEAGIVRLMADDQAPEAFGLLKAAVLQANPGGALKVYPGSPRLIAGRLRAGDTYVGAELRADDFAALSQAMAGSQGQAQALQTDGYGLVRDRALGRGRLFVLIDPPFEQPDDYDQIVVAMKPVLRRPDPATVLIWAPLKDLETFDGFLRKLELLQPPPMLVVEARLNPLHDPMKMNGCALVILRPPPGLAEPLKDVAEWVVKTAGGPGGMAKVWTLEA